MHDDDFRQELERLKTEALELAMVRLKGLGLEAVDVLINAMEDDNPSVRMRASQIVLSYGLKAAELKDVRNRLDMLEDALPLWAKAHHPWK